jgi:hypothetical protein
MGICLSFGVCRMSDEPQPSDTGLSGLSGVSRIGVLTRLPPTENEGIGFQPPSKISLEEHAARTQRTLAFVLVGMLAGSFAVHEGLVVLMTFHNRCEAIPTLEHTFNQWLPVLSGLVGTAVGFYLKERK